MAGAREQSGIVGDCAPLEILQRRRRRFQEQHNNGLGEIGPAVTAQPMQAVQHLLVDRRFAPLRRRCVVLRWSLHARMNHTPSDPSSREAAAATHKV